MTAWVLFSGLFGAVLGAWVKYWADVRAGRSARLLDEKLKHATALLAAADWVARTAESRNIAASNLANMQMVGKASPEAVQQAMDTWHARVDDAIGPWRDAQLAANALRLLVPVVAVDVDRYLELCQQARLSEDSQDSRGQSQKIVVEKLREQIELERRFRLPRKW